MKKGYLFFLTLFSFFLVNAQNTTTEEFNFMHKGFPHTIASGLDMKKGYYLADTTAFTTNNNTYGFYFLNMRRTIDKSLAGTIVISKSGVSGKTYYVAVPAAKSNRSIDLSHTLLPQIHNWDINLRTAFLQALAEYLMLMNTSAKK
jgi:hypothetical protein